MNSYPEAVAKIANDYLERVKAQLLRVPVRERTEFLGEIESHLYEAYQQTPGEDDIARILAVLRNLGEPADVVSERLPHTMVRSGAKHNLPLYIVGGTLIALFGIPLGFGGLGVLVGILGALAGLTVAFYATAGSILLVGSLFMLLGLTRMLLPQLFDRLVVLGVVQITPPGSDFLDQFSPSEQGLLMMMFGSAWLACGVGMLWLGKHLLRGLRFLFGLLVDRTRRFAEVVRRKLRKDPFSGPAHASSQTTKATPRFSATPN
jgi:uncharacterized membrane protein